MLVCAGPGGTRSPVQPLWSQVEAIRPNDCSRTSIYTDTTKVVRVAKRLEHSPSTGRVHVDLTDVAVAERQAEAIGPQRLDGPNGYHSSMLRQGSDADQPVVTPCSLPIGEELGLVQPRPFPRPSRAPAWAVPRPGRVGLRSRSRPTAPHIGRESGAAGGHRRPSTCRRRYRRRR